MTNYYRVAFSHHRQILGRRRREENATADKKILLKEGLDGSEQEV